jgi:hypothetical protein
MSLNSAQSVDNQASNSSIYLSKVAQRMVGKSFPVVFKTDASVSYISGIDSLMFDLLSVSSDATTMTNYGSSLDRYKKEPMKRLFESMFKIYPTKPVTVKDRWVVENLTTIRNNSGKMNISLTLKSI